MKGLKTGGRLPGTKNLLNRKAKEVLTQIIDDELALLPSLLDQLEPRERAFVLIKLLPYRLQKATIDENEPPVIVNILPGI